MQRNTMVGAVLTVLGLAILAAQPAAAAPQLMTSHGDQIPWYGADVNAMGGTGAALYRGGMSNVLNPAYLALEEGWRLDGGVSLDQHHEDRFQPLFDTFNSYVTDSGIASSRNHGFQTGFAAAHRLLDRGNGRGLSVGFSVADRYPFAYEFDEELRNPSPFDDPRDAIMQARNREITGTLRSFSLGVGGDLIDRVALGAAVHYNTGTRKDARSVRDFFVSDGDSSYATLDEHDLSGVNFTVGLRGVISERVEVGVAWESSFDATGDLVRERVGHGAWTADTVDGTVSYPNRYRAGLTFRPRTDPVTVLTIELEYAPWQDAETERYPGAGTQRLEDVTDVRIGVQHVFYNGVPVRFGFRHFDSYADRDAATSAFSAGVGAPVGDGLLQVSVELTKITAVMDHQFPYPDNYFGDQFVVDPQARVEDTRFRLAAGYTLAW
ncbi:MAG: hypothetical protein GY838_11545 [bacterium]|nr:hypothetical protein [bacterium]